MTYLYALNSKSQNVTLLPNVNLMWNVQLIERQTEKEMNHCSAPFWSFCQCSDSFRTETESWATCWQLVAKQKWKTLICITAPVNYSKQKFLRVTSTSDMTLSACASLRGLCDSVQYNIHMNCKSLRHQEATVISCPFLSLFMCPSKILALFLSLSNCCLLSPFKWIDGGQM